MNVTQVLFGFSGPQSLLQEFLQAMGPGWCQLAEGQHASTDNVKPGLIYPKQLFDWEGTIQVSDYDYWRSITEYPPNY